MNQIKETINLLKTLTEDQLVELFNDIDCEETAIFVREAADYYLRMKAQKEMEEFADKCCEKEWHETDYAQRYRDIKGEL